MSRTPKKEEKKELDNKGSVPQIEVGLITDKKLRKYAEQINRGEAVEMISINFESDYEDGDIDVIVQIILYSDVKKLVLHGIEGTSDIQKITEALKTNQKLTDFEFCNKDIEDEEVELVAEMLKENKTLTYLSLASNHMTAKGAQHITEALKVNNTLTRLNLGENNIGDEGAQALAEALETNSKLTEIYLYKNGITSSGARALSRSLDNLEILDLDRNRIEDEGTQALTKALEKNTKMKRISLSQNGITDNGAISMAKLLENNNTLVAVSLNFNLIEWEGFQALSQMLKVNNSLITFDIYMSKHTIEMARFLLDGIMQNNIIQSLHFNPTILSYGNEVLIHDGQIIAQINSKLKSNKEYAGFIKPIPIEDTYSLDIIQRYFTDEKNLTLLAKDQKELKAEQRRQELEEELKKVAKAKSKPRTEKYKTPELKKQEKIWQQEEKKTSELKQQKELAQDNYNRKEEERKVHIDTTLLKLELDQIDNHKKDYSPQNIDDLLRLSLTDHLEIDIAECGLDAAGLVKKLEVFKTDPTSTAIVIPIHIDTSKESDLKKINHFIGLGVRKKTHQDEKKVKTLQDQYEVVYIDPRGGMENNKKYFSHEACEMVTDALIQAGIADNMEMQISETVMLPYSETDKKKSEDHRKSNPNSGVYVVDSLKKWALAEIKFDNNKLLGKFSSINDFPYDLSIRGAKDIRQEHHDLIAGQIKEQKEKNPKLSPKNSDTNKLQNKNQNNQGTTSGLP